MPIIMNVGGGGGKSEIKLVSETSGGNNLTTPYSTTSYRRSDAFGDAVGNCLYIMCGDDSYGDGCYTVIEYNAVTNTKSQVFSDTSKNPLPFYTYGSTAVSANDLIYYTGGGYTSSEPSTVGYKFNPATKGFTSLANTPYAIHRHQLEYLDGKIYSIGGISGYYSTCNLAWAYDISANTWSTLKNVPEERTFTVGGVVGQYIYALLGALGSSGTVNHGYRYDTKANTYSKTSLPKSTASLSYNQMATGKVLNGKIYCIGGTNNGSSYNYQMASTIWEYDPSTDKWNDYSSEAVLGIYKAMSGVINGKMYVTAGTDSVTLKSVVAYEPPYTNYELEYKVKGKKYTSVVSR